jgi:hypothetical protein
MGIRLTKKRRLPEDTKGERVLTPYGEIHVSARTLEIRQDWDCPALNPEVFGRLCGALMFDLSAGLISLALADEIQKRIGRVQRGKSPLLAQRHAQAAK